MGSDRSIIHKQAIHYHRIELAIESGCKYNILQNDRTCKNCNFGFMENEYHFLLICPKFSDIRAKYIKNYY